VLEETSESDLAAVGCRFIPAAAYATDICSQVEPRWSITGTAILPPAINPLNVDEETLRRVEAAQESPRASTNRRCQRHERKSGRCRADQSPDRGRTSRIGFASR